MPGFKTISQIVDASFAIRKVSETEHIRVAIVFFPKGQTHHLLLVNPQIRMRPRCFGELKVGLNRYTVVTMCRDLKSRKQKGPPQAENFGDIAVQLYRK